MSASADLPKPGEVLAGKYEVLRSIGSGGMGAVFEARHLRLHQHVALKFLRPDLLTHADCVSRFAREGRAAARLTSPNVARIFDVDVTPAGIPYMVIELLDGHDLAAELRERKTVPVAEAVDMVLQACSAMADAHALGIVHRDLKPANLFLCQRGAGRTLKVLDFGVSKVLADELPHTTTPSITLGTPQYMSPEQILAAKDVDLRSDIWSLGVILYKLVSGELPFEAESATAFVVTVVTEPPVPLEKRASVPEELAAAVMKALAKKREDRWSCVEDFATAIQPFGSGRIAFTAPSAPPPSTPKLPPPPADEAGAITVEMDLLSPTTPALKPMSAALVEPMEPSSDAPPTLGNWSRGATAPEQRRRRMLMIAAAALFVVGLGGVGVYALETRETASRIAEEGSSNGGDRAPPAADSIASTATTASTPASSPATPSAAASASSVPGPRLRDPPALPSARSSASPRKPPPPPTPPVHATPTADPVHL